MQVSVRNINRFIFNSRALVLGQFAWSESNDALSGEVQLLRSFRRLDSGELKKKAYVGVSVSAIDPRNGKFY